MITTPNGGDDFDFADHDDDDDDDDGGGGDDDDVVVVVAVVVVVVDVDDIDSDCLVAWTTRFVLVCLSFPAFAAGLRDDSVYLHWHQRGGWSLFASLR